MQVIEISSLYSDLNQMEPVTSYYSIYILFNLLFLFLIMARMKNVRTLKGSTRTSIEQTRQIIVWLGPSPKHKHGGKGLD